MEQRDIVLRFFAPANEDTPKAVHPTVRPFHHPPPRLVPCLPLDLLRLLAPHLDVRREAELLQQRADFVVVISFVQAHPLGRVLGRLGTLGICRDALQRGLDQLHVVAVGAVDGQPQRNAVGVHEQTALDAPLGSIGRVFASLFPPQAAPWSCSRPWPATSSRCPSSRRRPRALPPTTFGRHLAAPTSESGRGPSSQGKSGWRSAPSIGSPCAGQTGWLPCRPGRRSVVCRRQRDGYSPGAESAGPSPPRGRPEYSTRPPPVDARTSQPPMTAAAEKQRQLTPEVIASEGLSG